MSPRAAADAAVQLERGREAYERRAWQDAYESLSLADQTAALAVEDLELLATSAYMLGRDDDYLRALERAHRAYLDGGEPLRAAWCAGWIGSSLALRGEIGQATGWLGRAQRLVEREGRECVEQGWLLVPAGMEAEERGDYESAYGAAAEAVRIGERFGDPDLIALGRHVQGRVLTRQGKAEAGLALLDEAMVAVVAGELSPIVTGLVYCSVIEGCQEVYELRRAREWTAALTRWCEEQPQMVSFTGRCLVHRAEIMQLNGNWPDALEEARRAGRRFEETLNPAAGLALYRQGELHRLQGKFAAAEQAYRQASRIGWEPQPGLALLRLAQGDRDAALGAIRRAVGEAIEPLHRTRFLPAYIDITLAVGALGEARNACRELEETTRDRRRGMLGAMVAHARGAVALADGEAWAALTALRQARREWQELGAPYESARARELVGLACRALGDADAAAMELEGAQRAFRELGAEPDVVRIEALSGRAVPGTAGGLTAREVEIARLVASGKTNRAIADELVISEKTVARHVSNIFGKLGVSSRSAVTAYAYEHGLVERST